MTKREAFEVIANTIIMYNTPRRNGKTVIVEAMKIIKDLIDEDEKNEWIPVQWRDMDDEEKEYYSEYYGDDITKIAAFTTPEDGEEILISRHNGEWVDLVEFCNDGYGIGDEDGNDWLYEVEAWRPLPKGYKKND